MLVVLLVGALVGLVSVVNCVAVRVRTSTPVVCGMRPSKPPAPVNNTEPAVASSWLVCLTRFPLCQDTTQAVQFTPAQVRIATLLPAIPES
ncbi:hypothetical protein D3C84_1007940 [compost metagenome]